MPELPEVQTIVSELAEKITHKKIEAVEVFKIGSVRPMDGGFAGAVAGHKVLGVARRAKLIIIELSGREYLLIHLKMTGQLVYRDKVGRGVSGGHAIASAAGLPSKFTRVMFGFGDGSELFFNDIRRFGWIKLVNQELYLAEISKYGLEPLADDFTLKKFTEKLKLFPKRKIKQLLMDQALIAGIGNIYADEANFASEIMPTRLAGGLTPAEISILHKALVRILKLAVRMKGTTADTYITTTGEPGRMKKYLKVYGRTGQPCRGCIGTVQKMKLAGRGTHFCPACQK